MTTKTKVSSLPELPTLDPGLIKGFEVSAWHAIWAPKGLPKDVTDKLVAALQAGLKDQKVIERLASLGTVPVPTEQATPQALGSHLAAEVPRWDAVIKAAGVKAMITTACPIHQLTRKRMKTYKIAAIQETASAPRSSPQRRRTACPRPARWQLSFTSSLRLGGEYYKKHGRMIPGNGRD